LAFKRPDARVPVKVKGYRVREKKEMGALKNKGKGEGLGLSNETPGKAAKKA